MANRWDRLADAIRDRRDLLGLTQAALAVRAGVSLTTVQNLEGGRQYKRLPNKVDKIERALGWTEGSCATILRGGEPTLLPEAGPGAAVALPADKNPRPRYTVSLPERVAHRLENGEVFAADVFHVGGLDVIIVAKAGTTPEDIERAFESQDQSWQSIRTAIEETARSNARIAIERVAQSNVPQADETSDPGPEK